MLGDSWTQKGADSNSLHLEAEQRQVYRFLRRLLLDIALNLDTQHYGFILDSFPPQCPSAQLMMSSIEEECVGQQLSPRDMAFRVLVQLLKLERAVGADKCRERLPVHFVLWVVKNVSM